MTSVITGRRPGEIRAMAMETPSWSNLEERITYRCRVHLAVEEGGGFSVYAASLPGVASQGETELEALANIVEAIEGAIGSYKHHGEEIPWLASPRQEERNELVRWVVVHG